MLYLESAGWELLIFLRGLRERAFSDPNYGLFYVIRNLPTLLKIDKSLENVCGFAKLWVSKVSSLSESVTQRLLT
jgi:hypothetical protein